MNNPQPHHGRSRVAFLRLTGIALGLLVIAPLFVVAFQLVASLVVILLVAIVGYSVTRCVLGGAPDSAFYAVIMGLVLVFVSAPYIAGYLQAFVWM